MIELSGSEGYTLTLTERNVNMKQLKIGIIGAGRIGSLHAKSITYNVPTATVVGITDVFTANAEKVAAKLNIPKIYKDYKLV